MVCHVYKLRSFPLAAETQLLFSGGIKRDKLKGTNRAVFRTFLQIVADFRFPENRRTLQIFAENCRKPQNFAETRFSHLVCPFNSSLNFSRKPRQCSLDDPMVERGYLFRVLASLEWEETSDLRLEGTCSTIPPWRDLRWPNPGDQPTAKCSVFLRFDPQALRGGRAPKSTETQKELKWPKSDSKVTPRVPSDSKVTQKRLKNCVRPQFWVTLGSVCRGHF